MELDANESTEVAYEDMEVFTMLDVSIAVVAAAAATVTLRAALI